MLSAASRALIVGLTVLALASFSHAQTTRTGDGVGAVKQARAEPASLADGTDAGDEVAHSNSFKSGNVSGTILDQSGAVMTGAHVRLTHDDQSPGQEVLSGGNGQYSFLNVTPGNFRLTIAANGFTTHVFSGILNSGEIYLVPPIVLRVANDVSEVWVKSVPIEVEIAEAQLKEQEKQRIFGIIPNFYVSYVNDTVALTPKQKFRLAWKSTVDPFTPVGVAFLAGVEQATDALPGYGQGMQGYAKRFGAAYADVVTGTFIGSAILPSVLKQDPRYFYKGTGSTSSRLGYALASPVICKGDSKHWQPNYSNILGSFAAGGISYLYYPESDRHGATLAMQTGLIRLGETAFEGVLQEFVIPRFTPHRRRAKP